MRVTFTEVDGIPTRYHHEGESGTPLMLVHGVGVSGECWLRNVDSLAEDFRVVAPDCMGTGFTGIGDWRDGPPHPHTVRHLIGLADLLGFDRFVLAGSSLGAMMSILTYFEIPDRVEKLVLISSGSGTLPEEEIGQKLEESYANGISAYANPTYAACLKRMQNVFYDPDDVPPELILGQLTTYRLPGALEAYKMRMEGLMDLAAMKPYRTAERLHEIAVPTLLIWGRDDPRVIYSRAEEAAARIPRSTPGRVRTLQARAAHGAPGALQQSGAPLPQGRAARRRGVGRSESGGRGAGPWLRRAPRSNAATSMARSGPTSKGCSRAAAVPPTAGAWCGGPWRRRAAAAARRRASGRCAGSWMRACRSAFSVTATASRWRGARWRRASRTARWAVRTTSPTMPARCGR